MDLVAHMSRASSGFGTFSLMTGAPAEWLAQQGGRRSTGVPPVL
jgi:hypothetical protein